MRIVWLTLAAASALAAFSAPATARSGTVPCNYPNGWTPEDHRRLILGLPPDAQHQCAHDSRGHIVDSHGRPTS